MEEGRRETAALAALVAAAATLRLFLAWRYPGFATGDDLETIETAGKYALGLRYQPWGIRCLFHPLTFLWPVLRAAWFAGARDPRVLTWAACLPAVAFSTLTAVAVHALARRLKCSSAAALAAAAFFAFHFLPLAFGSTAFPRPISTALLTLAFFVMAGEGHDSRRALLAGALAGAAFAVRWSEGVVLLPLAGWAAWKRRSLQPATLVLAGFAATAIVFVGAFDWATWGTPFASLWAYFETMYLEIPGWRLAQEKGFGYYVWNVFNWAGPVAMLLLLPAWRDRRARAPIATVAAIVVLMSLFAHKEWRYLQAAIPFLCIGAAFGWERLRTRFGAVAAAAVLVLGCAWGIERARTFLAKKSQAELAAARWIRTLRPPPRTVALEQSWAYGNRLYLGNSVEIREIEWQRPLTRLAVREAAEGTDLVAVYVEHLEAPAAEELRARGFEEGARFHADLGRDCVIYLARTRINEADR
jgi:hypothetical protein